MADSAAPSSSGSYSDLDMREIMEWQVFVMKTFKVGELDELLSAKSKNVKGRKEQKAMEVAWLYTRDEISQWRRERQGTEPPALLVNRQRTSDQGTLDKFFRRCRHEYVQEPTTGPRDNGEYTERCRLCGDIK